MFRFIITHSARLLPQAAGGHLGWLRGAIGAGCAIIFSGLVTVAFLRGDGSALPVLVAPLGASAVLVFAVPASPLAQPWSVVGGNLLSAAIGLAFGQFLGTPIFAAGLAVGFAIALMSVTRCLHPPGGACALLCALGASGGEAWDWYYMLPIAANVFALVIAGWLYNNLTGHPWPHRVMVPKPQAPAASSWTHEDIEAVLNDWNEVLDIDVDELEAIYQALQRRVKAGSRKQP